jgi:hypothetical protein
MTKAETVMIVVKQLQPRTSVAVVGKLALP